MLDQFFPSKTTKGRGQHRSTDKNNKNHGGRFGCFNHDRVEGIFNFIYAPGTPGHGNQQPRDSNRGHEDTDGIPLLDAFDVQVIKGEYNGNGNGCDNGQNCWVIGVALTFGKAIAPHDHGTNGTHRTGLIDSGHAEYDGSEHQKNKGQRWCQSQRNTFGEFSIVISIIRYGWRRPFPY